MTTFLPRDGEQLLLPLEGLVSLSRQPWGSTSPRVLTKAYERFTLKAQAGKSTGDCDAGDAVRGWAQADRYHTRWDGSSDF